MSTNDQAYARRRDPDTSHEAAGSISSQTLRRNQDAVWRFLRDHGPCTDRFMEDRYPYTSLPRQSLSGLRTRRNELVKKGLVEWTGDYETLNTGRRARIWKAVK